jgi:hypothetical protein
MEFKTSGFSPYCSLRDASVSTGVESWTTTPSADERSKWMTLQEVLTGNFTTFKCAAESRTTSTFQNEFSFTKVGSTAGSANPYDYLYFLPHHRFVSQKTTNGYWCAMGPDKSRSESWAKQFASSGGPMWIGNIGTGDDASGKAPGIRNYAVGIGTTFSIDQSKDEASGSGGDCLGYDSIPQDKAGLLDQFAYQARFGLMTFDAQVDASTGGSTAATVDGDGGELGQWSYYQYWHSGGTANCSLSSSSNCNCGGANVNDCATGKPTGCSTSPVPANELGARNPAVQKALEPIRELFATGERKKRKADAATKAAAPCRRVPSARCTWKRASSVARSAWRRSEHSRNGDCDNVSLPKSGHFFPEVREWAHES